MFGELDGHAHLGQLQGQIVGQIDLLAPADF